MTSFSTEVGGLLLKVRRTENGWEASIAGPSTIMNEETAKAMAEKFASAVVGKEVGSIKWTSVS